MVPSQCKHTQQCDKINKKQKSTFHYIHPGLPLLFFDLLCEYTRKNNNQIHIRPNILCSSFIVDQEGYPSIGCMFCFRTHLCHPINLHIIWKGLSYRFSHRSNRKSLKDTLIERLHKIIPPEPIFDYEEVLLFHSNECNTHTHTHIASRI